ncbi:Transposase [Nitrosomonas communis]|uniref:Transposase n=1 Tax=Nitrosomonas communis TaxID=44574 RepID=A0A1H2YND9_9PROT|nr:Transposase [Nitrosomonas communis]
MAAMLKRKAIVREQRVKNRKLKAQSRAGNTTKIHLAVDGYGLPVEFEITGGEVNDCSAAPDLIARWPDTKAMVADKGYDSECIREQITKKGARAVIPRKRNSLKGNADMDWGLYKYRHLVENAFTRLKQYRAIATRYDKLKRNYKSMVARRVDICGYLCEMSADPRIQIGFSLEKFAIKNIACLIHLCSSFQANLTSKKRDYTFGELEYVCMI